MEKGREGGTEGGECLTQGGREEGREGARERGKGDSPGYFLSIMHRHIF